MRPRKETEEEQRRDRTARPINSTGNGDDIVVHFFILQMRIFLDEIAQGDGDVKFVWVHGFTGLFHLLNMMHTHLVVFLDNDKGMRVIPRGKKTYIRIDVLIVILTRCFLLFRCLRLRSRNLLGLLVHLLLSFHLSLQLTKDKAEAHVDQHGKPSVNTRTKGLWDRKSRLPTIDTALRVDWENVLYGRYFL